MKLTITLSLMAILALAPGTLTKARAQEPNATYTLSGTYMRQVYEDGMKALEAGNYLIAHRFLSTYWSLTFGYGVFNNNSLFSAQLNQAIAEIETYYQNATVQRQALESQLQECQRQARGGVSSRGYGITAPMINLPRVPPER